MGLRNAPSTYGNTWPVIHGVPYRRHHGGELVPSKFYSFNRLDCVEGDMYLIHLSGRLTAK